MRKVLGVVLVALTAVSTVGLTLAPGRQALPAYAEHPVDTRAISRPAAALWIGDTYVAGAGASRPRLAYPQLVAGRLGWVLNTDAQVGTGFVTGGTAGPTDTTRPLVDRLPATAKAYTADVVILDAGRDDLDQPPADVLPAERLYLQRLAAAFPSARLVLVLPAFVRTTTPNDTATAIRADYTAFAARRPGTVVVDPATWFPSPDDDVSADLSTPNDAGHANYAVRLIAAFRAAGLPSSVDGP